ncbi:MAG: hypothetical protein ACU0CA_17250 [Paracoccaceae bacterium]
MHKLRALLVMTLISFSGSANAEMHLIMVEEQGCVWCARWNEEIAPIYPKTPEGQAAPLMRIDIHKTKNSPHKFARAMVFTPTFVLMQDDVEISRLEGYPGEDFFWGVLGKMLEDHSTAQNVADATN